MTTVSIAVLLIALLAFLVWRKHLAAGWALWSLAALVTGLSKENACLYVALLALVLAFRGAARRRAAAVAVLALGLFAAEMTLAFPRFRTEGFASTSSACSLTRPVRERGAFGAFRTSARRRGSASEEAISPGK